MYFSSQTDVSVRSAGYDSDIEDAFTLYFENSSFTTQVRLSGAREVARKTELQNGAYIVRVLVAMSAADYQKAMRYIENEEAAFRAYTFFRGSVPSPAPLGLQEKPRGFPDYYTWLRSACVILAVRGDAQYAGPLELFVKKPFKNALIHAEILDGEQIRLVCDASRYYGGIMRALEDAGLFVIDKDSSRLVLTPTGSLDACRGPLPVYNRALCPAPGFNRRRVSRRKRDNRVHQGQPCKLSRAVCAYLLVRNEVRGRNPRIPDTASDNGLLSCDSL
jgi:hypothetical protein